MTDTTRADALAVGDTVIANGCGVHSRLHVVASVADSVWDDRVILEFTDGCQVYALPGDATFTLIDA